MRWRGGGASGLVNPLRAIGSVTRGEERGQYVCVYAEIEEEGDDEIEEEEEGDEEGEEEDRR